MKNFVFIVVAVVWVAVFSPLHLGNEYLRSSTFDTVTVQRRETVWHIAHRYAADEKKVPALIEAIIEVNGLSPDGALRVGQRLQVPVLRQDGVARVAER